MKARTWSDWRALPLEGTLSPEVLAEILDGGQTFRWSRPTAGSGLEWTGTWAGHAARLRPAAAGALQWSAPAGREEETSAALLAYLDAGRDATDLADSLPWRSDAHLARCLQAFPGLRLLRQPLGETLLCFLCSAAKQIVQIKQIVAALAQISAAPRAGGNLPRRSSRPASEDGPLQPLPTWEDLATVPEAQLRACKLGFRARHVFQTAQFLAERPGWLEETGALPYAEARIRLCQLPGVGEKVADCVLLFGAGKLEAFPVDVWILGAMARRYGLVGWKPSQVAQFGRAHFGPHAGLAQQYLFAWERRNGKGSG